MENNCDNATESVEQSSAPGFLGEANEQVVNQSVRGEEKKNSSTEVKDRIVTYGKSLWSAVVSIWKDPQQGISKFLQSEKVSNSYGLVAIEVLLIILVACIVLKRVNKVLKMFSYVLIYVFDGDLNISYPKTIVGVILIALIMMVLYAAITMMIIKEFGKGECTFKQALLVYGVRLAGVIPFLVLTVLVSIFNIVFCVLLLILGILMGNMYTQVAVEGLLSQSESKKGYASYLIVVLYFIVFLVVSYMYIRL